MYYMYLTGNHSPECIDLSSRLYIKKSTAQKLKMAVIDCTHLEIF